MSTKVMLRNVRLSYEHIFKASSFDDSQDPKYSATLIIPKDHPDLPTLKAALKEAGEDEFGSAFEAAGWPKGYTCALRDADKDTNDAGETLAERNPEYRGCYIVAPNSTRRPLIIGRRKEALTEEDGVIYSGCYVNVSMAAAGYEYGKIKKGVKLYLNGVQFVKDGERFGADASDDFDALDGDDDVEDIF